MTKLFSVSIVPFLEFFLHYLPRVGRGGIKNRIIANLIFDYPACFFYYRAAFSIEIFSIMVCSRADMMEVFT